MPFQTRQSPPTPRPAEAGASTARPGLLAERELAIIAGVREQLTTELRSVQARRDVALHELRVLQADPTGSPGTQIRRVRAQEQLIEQLDARRFQIEADLNALGTRLTGGLLGSQTVQPPPPPPGPQMDIPAWAVLAISVVFIAVAIGPISVAIARLIWKRATTPRATAALDSGHRLDRLEHAVDSIAVEVERISEGQRYVTRLLTESPNFGALDGGKRVAEAVPVAPPARGLREG